MQNKRELGQYYTQENPFNHPLFKKWMVETGYNEDDTILEPFAGANNIPKLMGDVGFVFRWECLILNHQTIMFVHNILYTNKIQ